MAASNASNGDCPSLLRIVAAPSDTEDAKRDVCGICSVQFARYTCPKCNVCYCSLQCYKHEKHAQCSEQFYKDCFMEELKSRGGGEKSNEEKAKMVEILKRLKEQHEDEEGSTENGEQSCLEERLAGINLDADSDQVWQALTMKERDQFQSMLQDGSLGSLVDTHKPWWKNTKRVQFVDDASSDLSENFVLPPLPSDIPPLSSLVKGGVVSPCICHNIVNVLYSYAYTVRMFNCWHYDLPASSAQAMLTISAVLSQDLSFTTTQDALHHAMGTVLSNIEFFNSIEYSSSVLKDVSSLLGGTSVSKHSLVQHALADAHKLLRKGRAELKSKNGKTEVKLSRQMWLAKKKIVFFLSWTVEKGKAELPPLEKIVNMEYEAKQGEIQQESEDKEKVSRVSSLTNAKQNGTSTQRKTLIEELS